MEAAPVEPLPEMQLSCDHAQAPRVDRTQSPTTEMTGVSAQQVGHRPDPKPPTRYKEDMAEVD